MSQQSHRPDASIAVCRDFFIKSKSVCAVPSGSAPRNLTLCGRRRATGIREWLCFIERKDKTFVSNRRIFLRENILIFRSCETGNKNTGTFFDPPLVSLIAPPLSPVALLLWGESGSCFLAPLGVRSVSRPSGWCALAHDALARGDAHPRLAYSASFHFFAFTHHLQPAELLLVRCEDFCISMICSGG